MKFSDILQRKIVQTTQPEYHLPHRTSFCLQFLFDSGFTPVVFQQTGSVDFSEFDVYREINNNPLFILTPTDNVIPNLSDLSFRTGFEFDSSNKLIKTAYIERIRARYRGEQLALGDSRTSPQEQLCFNIYPDKTLPLEMFKRRGTFTIGQNRNIIQLKN